MSLTDTHSLTALRQGVIKGLGLIDCVLRSSAGWIVPMPSTPWFTCICSLEFSTWITLESRILVSIQMIWVKLLRWFRKCSAIVSRELIARTDWKNAINAVTERDDTDADVEQWCWIWITQSVQWADQIACRIPKCFYTPQTPAVLNSIYLHLFWSRGEYFKATQTFIFRSRWQ